MSGAVNMAANRIARFYDLLNQLERFVGGKRRLSNCSGRMAWPARGVYFFFENGETRSDSGTGPRVVRVGTHALAPNSRTSLWNRLSQHRGSVSSGGGNHRGSIFRLIVGTALSTRDAVESLESWGKGSSADSATRLAEREHERRVSSYIGGMPFLWLDVGDDPGRDSLRGVIERNAIALLSNYHPPVVDPPSADWLGHFSDRPKVRRSGLWNQNHVDGTYDPAFLAAFERLIDEMEVS